MKKGEITVRIETDAGFDDLMSIAGHIGELVDMIPEYQHYQAEEITDMIGEDFKKIMKLGEQKRSRTAGGQTEIAKGFES